MYCFINQFSLSIVGEMCNNRMQPYQTEPGAKSRDDRMLRILELAV